MAKNTRSGKTTNGRRFWFVVLFGLLCLPAALLVALRPVVGDRALEDGPLRPLIIVACIGLFFALLPAAIRSETRAQKGDPIALRVNAHLRGVASALGGAFVAPQPDAPSPYGEVNARLAEGEIHIENRNEFAPDAWGTRAVVRLALATGVEVRFEIRARADGSPDPEALALVPESSNHLVQEIMARWASTLTVDAGEIVCVCQPWYAKGAFKSPILAPDSMTETVEVARALAALARGLVGLDARSEASR